MNLRKLREIKRRLIRLGQRDYEAILEIGMLSKQLDEVQYEDGRRIKSHIRKLKRQRTENMAEIGWLLLMTDGRIKLCTWYPEFPGRPEVKALSGPSKTKKLKLPAPRKNVEIEAEFVEIKQLERPKWMQ